VAETHPAVSPSLIVRMSASAPVLKSTRSMIRRPDGCARHGVSGSVPQRMGGGGSYRAARAGGFRHAGSRRAHRRNSGSFVGARMTRAPSSSCWARRGNRYALRRRVKPTMLMVMVMANTASWPPILTSLRIATVTNRFTSDVLA
jgi:hypothetical protein